jgi:hypothetical protein
MHISELEHFLEHSLSEAVQRHFPLDWKEDPITHHLLIRIRQNLSRTTVYGVRYPLEIQWEIYKFHGKRESAYGDIGLLVQYKLPGNGVIEGAGFLEAKLRGRDTTKFLQVRHEQVTRILSRSPQTRLLLYDYNPVAVLEPTEVFPDWDHPFFSPKLRIGSRSVVSHGPVLPLQLAAAVNQYDDTLYRFASSFSYQFCYRYLNLHDLDFSETAIRAVKGFPEELGSPSIVMIIRAAPQGQELPEGFRPNDNLYGPLE